MNKEEHDARKQMRLRFGTLVSLLSSNVIDKAIHAANTLQSLAMNANGIQSILDTGAIPPLVEMFHSNNVKCKIVAMTLMQTIVDAKEVINTRNVKELACRAGALHPLVAMLDSHEMRCRSAALSLIFTFAIVKGLEKHIVNAGVLKPLIAILQLNDECMLLVLKIIGNLAFDQLEQRIANAGTIPLLAEIVCSNNTNAAVDASVALWNLSAYHPLKTQIMKTNIIQSLLRWIQHVNDRLKLDFLGLLNNLSDAKESKQEIVDGGVPRVLIELLTDVDDDCQCKIMSVIAHLSKIETCSHQIANTTRGIVKLVQMLSSNIEECVCYALTILCNMSAVDCFELPIVEANAVKPTVAILLTNKNKECRNSASAILHNLSWHSAKSMILVDNLLPALSHGLISDVDEIRESCFLTFKNIHRQVRVNPVLHLLQGTIPMFRSIMLENEQPLVDECFQFVVLKPNELTIAMSLLSSLLSTNAVSAAVTVCAGIVMSCEHPCSSSNSELNPSLLSHPMYHSLIHNTFVKAFETGGKCVVDIAVAIQYMMRLVECNNIDSPTVTTLVETIWDDMSLLRTNEYMKLADLVCLVDQEEFHVHKSILVVRSSYFQSLIRANMVEQTSNKLVIRNCKPSVFNVVITFLYSGKLVEGMLTQDNAQDVLFASDRFQITHLHKATEAYLKTQLHVSNAILMWQLAIATNAKHLEQACIHFILLNCSDLVQCKEFECKQSRSILVDAFFKKMDTAFGQKIKK